MTVSKGRKSKRALELTMDGSMLTKVFRYEHLGVMISDDLTQKCHIENITAESF